MVISILSSSTRINRQSHRVALALRQHIGELGYEALLLDLSELRFPLMEEVLHRHPNPPADLPDFASAVRQSDALIFVSPEYNGSYTAALKNAVDYLKENEFANKVIGVAAVTAGNAGGVRAALAMQQLVLGIGGIPIPQMLLVGAVTQRFDEHGQLTDPTFSKQMQQFLDAFCWLSEAVKEKKAAEQALLHL
jgi:NAD(P)H-dependent FMN reductase